MKMFVLTAVLQLAALCFVSAQKTVLSIPFEFEKRRLASSDYDAYFLENRPASTFAIVLKDNEKTRYLSINSDFKTISTIDAGLKNTVFNKGNNEYRGGTATGDLFHFIYQQKAPSTRISDIFQSETIDFTNKTVKQTRLFDVPRAEKLLLSFSDNNVFYTITADDDAKQLVFYSVDGSGEARTQHVPFTVPPGTGRKRDKVSEYLSDLKVIKSGEEPDMSASVSSAKLFSNAGSLDFVINDAGNPANLVRIKLPGFTAEEKKFDFSKFQAAGSKQKMNVNSYLRNNRLFSVILDKKNIQVAVHDIMSGTLINQYNFNEDNYGTFTRSPVTERRYGKSLTDKDVDNFKQLAGLLDRGTEGIMVTENSEGQLVLTVGTYNAIPVATGGYSGGGFSGGFENAPGAPMGSAKVWTPYSVYRPGYPTYTTNAARYYTTTYFKLLMDPAASKLQKGKISTPVPDQIKEYMQDTDQKAKATNQFSMGQKQYYGYYDSESKMYRIEEIKLRK